MTDDPPGPPAIERIEYTKTPDLPDQIASADFAAALGHVVFHSGRLEHELRHAVGLIIHKPEPAGHGTMVRSLPTNSASVEAIIGRANFSRKVAILLKLVDLWWPGGRELPEVKAIRDELLAVADLRNHLMHDVWADRILIEADGKHTTYTTEEVEGFAQRIARASFRMKMLIEGLAFDNLAKIIVYAEAEPADTE